MNNINKTVLAEVLGKRQQYVAQPGLSVKLAKSDVLCGIEIELEEFRHAGGGLAKLDGWWDEHVEGSLVQGREFVLFPPRNGAQLDKGIDLFFDQGFRYTGGERTSVHIHVDMLDGTTVGQFRAMFALTYLLEGAVYRIADENRKWGGYSSPLIDMGPARLNKILNGKTNGVLHAGLVGSTHEDKYYGFNSVSLTKHGTLEFRYFPCTDDKQVMYQWLNLVLEIKIAASKFADATELLEKVKTQDDLLRFVREYLPRSADAIIGYMDRPDAVERGRILTAILGDEGAAEGPSKIPRGFGESRSLKRAVERLGWAKKQVHEDNGEELPPARAVNNLADLVLPDGQVDAERYADLMKNIRARAARLANV